MPRFNARMVGYQHGFTFRVESERKVNPESLLGYQSETSWPDVPSRNHQRLHLDLEELVLREEFLQKISQF